MEEKMIRKLQENLHTIRRLLGWTTQDMGDLLGITKQTISNLENMKTLMTKIQYIAIRTIIADEIANKPEEERKFLTEFVSILLDNNSDIPESRRKAVVENLELMTAAVTGGASIASIIKAMGTAADVTLSSVPKETVKAGMALTYSILGAGAWLPNLLSDTNKRKQESKHPRHKQGDHKKRRDRNE